MKEKKPLRVGLFVPTWNMRPWTKLVSMLINETHWSKHLTDYEFVEHVSPELARERMTGYPLKNSNGTARLACRGGDLDAVLMVDDDQALEVLVSGNPVSVVDHIVRQYESGARHRVLVGVTPIGNEDDPDALNVRRSPDGSLAWAGSGCLFVPSCVVRRLLARWPRPWWPEPSEKTDLRQGEDIRFTLRCVEVGVPLEPIRGLRVWHAPAQRRPLFHEEPQQVVPEGS